MPCISVIVPVYKVEMFLRRCVDSILCQSFEDFELILIDDGSPDRSGMICDAYAEKDDRVRVIHQKNGGLSAARNTGIDFVMQHSNSRWLVFVDSDDWVHPDFLRRLYDVAEQTLCKISSCAFFNTTGEALPEEPASDVIALSADDYYCGNVHDNGTPAACNKLYNRALFKTLRFPIGKLHEDEFTTYIALYKAGRIGVTMDKLYAYYQNPEGITHSEWHPRRMHNLEAFEQQIRFAEENKNSRLLKKTVEQYIYSIYEHLQKAQIIYHKELRKKLRAALKMGRECGCFGGPNKHLWAYEEAYPCKPYWWLRFKIQQMLK